MSHFWQKVSAFVRRSSSSLLAVSAAAGSGHFYYARQGSTDQPPCEAKRVLPALVNVVVPCVKDGVDEILWEGSGTIIRSDGTILTCAHVLEDAHGAPYKGKVYVTLQNGLMLAGRIVNSDVRSDIAILKIDSRIPLPTASFCSTSMLHPGDKVLALGCNAILENRVASGTVSHVNRGCSSLNIGDFLQDFIHTSCPIVDGHSGGPLVNSRGEIVGIIIGTFLHPKAVSCAIPVDSVIRIIDQFQRNGRVVRPWLGLYYMIDLSQMIIAQFKRFDATFPNVDKGVFLPVVIPGTPADRAGFQPGDFVVEFDGEPVESVKEISDLLENCKVGEPLKVVVKRPNDVTATLTVTPEEAPEDFYSPCLSSWFDFECLYLMIRSV